jgi:hypothetical protein
MTIEVKDLGLLDRFNGIDVVQTKWYIKLTCSKYLQKMLTNHGWLIPEGNPLPTLPLPLNPDKTYIDSIENATPPTTEEDKIQLQLEMGFKYRQVMGEIIYPCFKARPEISPAAIKLSQYIDNPAREHYTAIFEIIQYLAATLDEGIYYWRQAPVHALPEGPLPHLHSDNHELPPDLLTSHPHNSIFAFADSDWGSDKIHRKSITGIVIMFANGTIGYKTKYQDTIAHSSTEAEFCCSL